MKVLGNRELGTSYDYIVVGAGSSGCPLASRLSEIDGATVLLLEAGEDNADWQAIKVPSLAPSLQFSKVDWAYKTVPQKHACKGLKNQQSQWPRGKVLGGSSCLNHLQYYRGSGHDYDLWEAMGCEGWGYENVLPYFVKSENNEDPTKVASGYHGRNGPLNVTDMRATPIGDAFVKAGQELGYPATDLNGANQEGFQTSQGTIRNGERQTTSDVFLRPVMWRPNLDVAVNAHVAKVIIENPSATAVGVELIDGTTRRIVRCRREVILSAGAIGSPQILLLSGIGPRHHLENMKIPVVRDLPVGENLQDHLFVDNVEYTIDKPISLTGELINSQESWVNYKFNGKGPLASAATNEACAFIRSELQDPNAKYPDIQIHILSALRGNSPNSLVKRNYRMKDEVWESLHGGMEGQHGFNFHAILLHPKSKGTVRLRSANPFDDPLIDPQYLTHRDDVTCIVKAVKLCQQLAETKPFKELGAKPTGRTVPGYKEKGIKPFSDEYWEHAVRHCTMTLYHPTGTCKMGAIGDKTAVVDPYLRVQGIQGLRVADCSIMPEIVSGNTNAPAIMIGERAADIIKGKPSLQLVTAKL